MNLQDLKKYKLPDSPGVYIFSSTLNAGKSRREILYIGKATSLRARVRSYFSNDLIKTRGPILVDMVTKASYLEFIKTDSVLEALILEAELIKKHKPIANTKEKDNKSYNFVVITKEELPRVFIERGRSIDFDKTKYKKVFGPFISKQQLDIALGIIRKIFPFLSKEVSSNFYKQIGLEPEVSNTEAKKEYLNNIKHISLFLSGKKKEVIKQLMQEMKTSAKNQQFEKSVRIRNKIFALKHIHDVSLIKRDGETKYGDGNSFRIESYDVAHISGTNSVGVMTVVEGDDVKKSDYRKFILRKTRKGDDVGGIEEILSRRLKHSEWQFPDLVVVDGGVGQRNRAVKVLKERGLNIPVIGVIKNNKHKPERLLGPEKIIKWKQSLILLSNNEAHRFATSFYRLKHRKGNLK